MPIYEERLLLLGSEHMSYREPFAYLNAFMPVMSIPVMSR